MKKLIKMNDFKKLMLCTTVILAIFYAYILIVNGGSLLFWGDEADEVIQMYNNIYVMIKSGNLSFWNQTVGLGANQFVMFFTVLGSPSFYFALLCPTKEWFVYLLPLVDIIRFYAIVSFSFIWISKLTHNSVGKIVISLSFAFCGWTMYFIHFPYYMDTFIYLPLLLYLCEEMLENKKYTLFSIVIALMGILSLYQLYMVSWLIFFYCTCRFIMKNNKFEFKLYFLKLIKVLSYYFLGIGLAAVIIIPCILILLSTNRIMDASTSIFAPIDLGGMFRIFTSLFSPVINDFDYNIYSSPFVGKEMVVYTVYNYSLILFPLLLPQLFKIKFQGKKALVTTTLLLYLLLFFKFSYFIFNGNTSVRWSFFFNVFNCLILAYLFEYRDKWDMKLLKKSMLGVVNYTP